MGNSSPNLGQAISLQYRIPQNNFPAQEISRRRAEEQAAIDAARKAHAKSLEKIDKYRADLDKFNVEGIIAPLQNEVKAYAADMHKHIKQRMAENENYNPNADDDLRSKRFELDQVLAKNRVSSKAYLDDVNKAINHPELFQLNTKFTDAVGKGSMDEWVVANDEIHSGSTGGAGVYTHGAVTSIKPKSDWRKSLFNYSNQAGKVTTSEGAEYVADSTKKQLFDSWKNTPDYQSAVAEYGTRMPLENVDKMIYESDWLPQFAFKAATERKEQGTDILTIEDIQENVPVNIIEGSTGKKVEDTAHYGITLPSNVLLNIPATKNIIDRSTGKQLDYTGQLNVRGGKLLSTKISGKFVPMLYTTTSVQEEDEFGAMKTVTKDIEIPLAEIRGQKVLEKHKVAIDEFDKKTSSLNQPKQAGKKDSGYSNVTSLKDSSGKIVKAGVKDGKWYNTETGKPLQP